jgi:hypothetical protein
VAFVLAGLAVLAAPATSQPNREKVVITALGVNMSNFGRATTAQVDFTVERWTTEQEREQLINAMLERGADRLLQVLKDMPSHGFMRVNSSLGWDLRYAWQTGLPDGGRRIVLATDRPITVWEAQRSARTMDYPFTVVELRVNKDGEGEGKMSVATKIEFDKENKIMELENYASQPVRLQSVRIRK